LDDGFGGLFLAEEEDAEVELGFVEAGLEFEDFVIGGDGFRVAVKEAEGEAEVEAGGDVFGGFCDGFGEEAGGVFVALGVEGFHAFGGGVLRCRSGRRGSLEPKSYEERGGHDPSLRRHFGGGGE
jgi:hypothetical protein